MTPRHNVRDRHELRDLIDKLLDALGEGAEFADGVRLRIAPETTIAVGRTAVGRTESLRPRAVLTFAPPPELSVRRGPFHLRCGLRSATIGRDEVHLAIDGWFDRRWRVES
jgi:hypothetical protein